MLSNKQKNQHLLWRAAFGPMAENSARLEHYTQAELWNLLVSSSKEPCVKIDVAQNLSDIDSKLTAADKRKIRRQYRDDLKNMNLDWLSLMVNSKCQLREKMSLFWHGHFACRVVNSYSQQELLHVIRTNALGNFKNLLLAVSKSPSMLQFLNNQQNRKQHPNENFAREVMELFTMGRGNYKEQDVKEAARSFTGWGFNKSGEFVFRKFQHDDGEKEFLGEKGNFTGDDIIRILLEQEQTAYYITEKIYRFFVNDVVDEKSVKILSKNFFASGYDITSLLTEIFTSEWFYDPANVGNRIKSPVELIVGIRRFLPLTMEKEVSQIQLQKGLGQMLFFPPNVAGWPGGKNWIDSSSLMIRLRIPQAFAMNETMDVKFKEDDDLTMGNPEKTLLNRFGSTEIKWPAVYSIFKNVKKEQLAAGIKESVLQNTNIDTDIIEKFSDKTSRENYIKSMVIHLMCTPEYQLC